MTQLHFSLTDRNNFCYVAERHCVAATPERIVDRVDPPDLDARAQHNNKPFQYNPALSGKIGKMISLILYLIIIML